MKQNDDRSERKDEQSGDDQSSVQGKEVKNESVFWDEENISVSSLSLSFSFLLLPALSKDFSAAISLIRQNIIPGQVIAFRDGIFFP